MLIVILGDAPKVISMLPSANHVCKPVEHANQDLYCFLHDLQLVWQTHYQVIARRLSNDMHALRNSWSPRHNHLVTSSSAKQGRSSLHMLSESRQRGASHQQVMMLTFHRA